MQAKIDETVKKLNDLEMMQGVIKDAVKDSAKRGTTFDTTQYKWVQEDMLSTAASYVSMFFSFLESI